MLFWKCVVQSWINRELQSIFFLKSSLWPVRCYTDCQKKSYFSNGSARVWSANLSDGLPYSIFEEITDAETDVLLSRRVVKMDCDPV